ncbi:MAG: hypothetical protein HFH38_12980 [Lachnospiraceae bacterium]|jgi:hypothetical protein|nr:hypothetical protein [Lachnospiraceae bacterium]
MDIKKRKVFCFLTVGSKNAAASYWAAAFFDGYMPILTVGTGSGMLHGILISES